MRRREITKSILAGLAVACMGMPGLALAADDYPAKPITIIVPYGTGGSNDSVARILADGLSKHFGKPVVVENRPGGGGALGAERFLSSPADGYTLLVADAGSQVASPLYNGTVAEGERPFDQYQTIRGLVDFGLVLTVGADSDIKSVADIVAEVKADPASFSYASAGMGSTTHLTGALMSDTLKAEFIHIPFASGGEASTAVAGGHVDAVFSSVASASSLIKGNLLRAIAVTTPKRDPRLPDVPTFTESGIDIVVRSWIALVAQKDVDPAIVEKLSQSVEIVLKEPQLVASIEALGLNVTSTPREQFAAEVKSDIDLWARIVEREKAKE